MRNARSETDRLFLATRAIRKDPDCIETNLVVAAHCKGEELRLAYLNIAVEAGEELRGSATARRIVGGSWASVPGAAP